MSLIDYVQSLRRETSTLLDTVVTQITTPTTEQADYRAWGDHWCPRHVEVHSTNDAVRKVAEFCGMAGGWFQEPYCRSSTGPERILFYAQFQRGVDYCQGAAATVAVQIVEPKPGMSASAGYLAKLHELGYRSRDEAKLAQTVQRRTQEEAQAKEQERLAQELPLLRTRGTRVCNRQNGTLFVGYVEDISGPKIQVGIHEAYVNAGSSGRGIRNPSYKPENVWDFPEHWYVCE